jgi:histidyl-tRNA synthetase
MWKLLQLNELKLEINSLGSREARLAYRNQLVEYFSDNKGQLDDDSISRLEKNPLRILDSKNPDMRNLINQAPSMADSLDLKSRDHFTNLQEILDAVEIKYVINPRLVRGLDYYNRTVFEWITDELGAQGAVCAGGRYDGMIEHFGGPPTPAIGFAMGIERLAGLLNTRQDSEKTTEKADIYFVVSSEQAQKVAMSLAEKLRDDLPQVRMLMHCGGGSFKNQFKKADKSGAQIALIMGENELKNQRIGVKTLREGDVQLEVAWSELTVTVRNQLDI